jgi:WD40 repeat protein
MWLIDGAVHVCIASLKGKELQASQHMPCVFAKPLNTLSLRRVLCLQVIAIVSRADGNRAASIGVDGCLRLWDTSTGCCISNKVNAGPPACRYLGGPCR